MNLRFPRTIGAAICAAALALTPFTVPEARADTTNCTTIVSLPRNITASGHYCLAANLTWSGTSGSAITVNRNSVTIDCNGYSIKYLGTDAVSGVLATGRSDLEVRHCTFENFYRGIYINPGTTGSHRVHLHDNTLVGSRYYGMQLTLRHGLILDNRVLDTSGNSAIYLTIDAGSVTMVNGNVIRGVTGLASSVNGIYIFGGGRAGIRDNQISDIGVPTTTTAAAIRINTAGSVTPLPAILDNNHIYYPMAINNIPVAKASSTAKSRCDNVVVGTWAASSGCL